MAITIDWGTRVIYIPRNDLTLIQSSPVEIRELNLNWFRLQLKDLEDSEEGMIFPDTHRHNTEVSLGGLTFARVIEIINDYTLLFEDGQYAVNLVGANSNVGDRVNVNQVSVRSANSAGLISSPAIEYSSYNQGVTVDIESSFTGTVFPVGTPQAPVNNLADALLICQYRGFDTIFVKRSMTIDSGGDYHGYTFVGESYTKTTITISDAANVFECEFRDAQLAGVLDGGSVLRDCRIFDLDYIDGIIEDCILDANGTILLSGSRFANIINCVSGRLDTLLDIPPIIDMGGSGTSLAIRNYSGSIQIINKSGPENVDIDLSSGIVVLDPTVVSGTVQVRGSGQLIDNSSGTVIVDSDGLISKASIVEAIEDTIGPQIEYASFNGGIWVDTVSGTSGTVFPIGTPSYPVNNINDAKTIAEYRGFNTINILSNLTVASGVNIDYYTIKSSDWWLEVTVEPGASCLSTNFEKLSLFGELSGVWNVLTDCWTYEITNFAGWLIGGSFIEITLAPYNEASLGQSWFDTIVPMYPNEYSIINMSTDTYISCTELNGLYEVTTCTSGSFAEFDFSNGDLLITDSCSGGEIVVRGTGAAVDNSTGALVNTIGLMSKTAIVEAIEESIGPEIEYASFNGGVAVDVESTISGTAYPIGTSLSPVNNLWDAKTIAVSRGFKKFIINGEITIPSGFDAQDFTFAGSTMEKSILTVSYGANVLGCVFKDLYLQGDLGGSFVRCSRVRFGNITGACGDGADSTMTDCIFSGLSVFKYHPDSISCVLVIDSVASETDAATTSPTIDLNGSHGCFKARNIAGGFFYANVVNGNILTLAYHTGLARFLSSNTDFTCYIGGSVILMEEQTGGTVVKDAILSRELIAEAVWDELIGNHLVPNTAGHELYHQAYDDSVFIDVLNGGAGTTFPIGTRHDPTNNLADALSIAHEHNFKYLSIVGSLTITSGQDISGFTIKADKSVGNYLVVQSGAITNLTYVQDLTVMGTMGGSVRYTTCVLGNINNFDGGAKNCLLTDNIVVTGLGSNYLTDCDTYSTDINAFIGVDVGPNKLNIIRGRGHFEIKNKTGETALTIDLVGGDIKVANTCVAGVVEINGTARVIDESAAGCEVINLGLSNAVISETVWSNEKALRVLGLLQENQYLDNTTYTNYNGQKLLSSGRIRIYSDAVSVGTSNNVVATYNIIASWSGDEMQSYKVVKI